MSDRFKVSRLLSTRLRERKISVPAVLRHAGLPTHFLDQERIFATTSELFALWKAIGEVSGDPEIGLKLGSESRFERYDATEIAAVCSRSYRDALQRIAERGLSLPNISSNCPCIQSARMLLFRSGQPIASHR